jgi:hypothetical protein
VPRVAQAGAGIGGAAVLPYDGAVDGAPRVPVPDHGGFALVGDADGGDVGTGDPRLLDGGAAGGGCGGPQVARVVLDPAGIGVMLRKFLLRGGDGLHACVEKDRAARRGALVDGEDMGHCGAPLLS